MSANLHDEAKKLAERPYSVGVAVETMDDGVSVYVVSHPELPGCMSHGDTFREAKANLDDARLDYIEALLADGLPVPEPAATPGRTEGTGTSNKPGIADRRAQVSDAAEPTLVPNPEKATGTHGLHAPMHMA